MITPVPVAAAQRLRAQAIDLTLFLWDIAAGIVTSSRGIEPMFCDEGIPLGGALAGKGVLR